MFVSYVRTATDIQRMTDLAFFARFGEASRAVRYLPGTASEVRGAADDDELDGRAARHGDHVSRHGIGPADAGML